MNLSIKCKQFIRCIPGVYRLYSIFRQSRAARGVPRYYLNRGSLPRIDPDALKRSYEQSPLGQMPDSFVLYRIIGNDLVPRHRKGQSRDNLRFILENEPDLSECEKRFVVNRIVDSREEETILAMLRESGYSHVHIPFSWEEYRKVSWDIQGVPYEYAPYTQRFASLNPAEQSRVMMRLYRYKNNYVMNNNGARNAALAEGRQLAKWVLSFDGNCFIIEKAWQDIVREIKARPFIPYFIVPMARIIDNNLLLDPDFKPEALEEPQVIFRRDSRLCFDQEFFYGRRPKVELLWRLGVPGPWDQWYFEPWDLSGPEYSEEAGCFGYAGWVARLDSGQAGLEENSKEAQVNRGLARNEAISNLLDHLDFRVFGHGQLDSPMIIHKPLIPEELVRQTNKRLLDSLYVSAEEAMGRGPYSVIDKTTLPPSGDPHDYWHPAPYYWPNPLTPSGRPYVRRDGQRVPGTRLYEPESDKYDRTRLQRLFDDTLVLALAWQYFRDKRFAEHAALLVRTWFLDQATAMNPSLNFTQVRLGHDNDLGSNYGIIEMKDLYYFLDALRILKLSGLLSADEQSRLGNWFRQYLQWLQTSTQGRKERSSANNHGLYYDLQSASIAAYLGDILVLRNTLRDSRFRILQHFDSQGRQPEEMKRTMTAHYCCFNLQGWIHLALLAESCGEDLWCFTGQDGRGIKRSMYWLLSHLGKEWPYEQIESFDYERFYPIYYACKSRYGLPSELESTDVPAPVETRPIFYPHDGIRPFWQLSLD